MHLANERRFYKHKVRGLAAYCRFSRRACVVKMA